MVSMRTERKMIDHNCKDHLRSFYAVPERQELIKENSVSLVPSISYRVSPDGASSSEEMGVLEQNIDPELKSNGKLEGFDYPKTKLLMRSGSAPQKRYKEELLRIDNIEKERRRNSSIDISTSKVRFKLEESFKEEEERYLQLAEVENEDFNNYKDIEIYKTKTIKDIQKEIYLVNSKDDTSKKPSQRQRKVSVVSRRLVTPEVISSPIKVETKMHCLEPCQVSSYNNEINEIKEEVIPKKTISAIRKKSLQLLSSTTKKLSERKKSASLTSINSFKDKTLSSTSSNEDISQNRKQRKKSRQENTSLQQFRKKSIGNGNIERKTSITDTIRAAVSSRKMSDRKNSVVTLHEYGFDNKKSKWGAIRDKMKLDRRSSSSGSPNQSPRNFRFSRNDSMSSVGSNSRFSRNSLSRRSSERSQFDGYDKRSIVSLNSFDGENGVDEPRCSIPYANFKLWSNDTSISDTNLDTLPLLHVACAEGNIELVNTLIDCGVNVNEIDHNGWPAIHYAVCAGHFECVSILIHHGATLKTYTNRVMNTYCNELRRTMKNC